MNVILSKHKGVTPLKDPQAVDALLSILVETPIHAQQRMWMKDLNAGYICIFRHESRPGVVIEYVQGTQEDSITTLYAENPMFADLADLARARWELITEIAAIFKALPSHMAFPDEGRGRDVQLREMGTAQLMDILAKFTNTDLATL